MFAAAAHLRAFCLAAWRVFALTTHLHMLGVTAAAQHGYFLTARRALACVTLGHAAVRTVRQLLAAHLLAHWDRINAAGTCDLQCAERCLAAGAHCQLVGQQFTIEALANVARSLTRVMTALQLTTARLLTAEVASAVGVKCVVHKASATRPLLTSGAAIAGLLLGVSALTTGAGVTGARTTMFATRQRSITHSITAAIVGALATAQLKLGATTRTPQQRADSSTRRTRTRMAGLCARVRAGGRRRRQAHAQFATAVRQQVRIEVWLWHSTTEARRLRSADIHVAAAGAAPHRRLLAAACPLGGTANVQQTETASTHPNGSTLANTVQTHCTLVCAGRNALHQLLCQFGVAFGGVGALLLRISGSVGSIRRGVSGWRRRDGECLMRFL